MLGAVKFLLVVSVSGLFLMACASSNSSTKASEQLPGRPDILNGSGAFAEQAVRVNATFRGWRGSCPGPPPVSRSDWMVEDTTGCIYIHGPLPPGLDPAKPEPRQLTIIGQWQIDQTGQPYIELNKGFPVKGSPSSRIER